MGGEGVGVRGAQHVWHTKDLVKQVTSAPHHVLVNLDSHFAVDNCEPSFLDKKAEA